MLKAIDSLRMEWESNIPFVYKMFNEQMDKTVHEAKSEIDAFITGQITRLGLDALKDNYKMLEKL